MCIDDFHIRTLTVRETIEYSAWTRMKENTTLVEKNSRVKALLEIMNLSTVSESVVGDAMHKGISGGQLKRLSIAVEIVALPGLIFLDEVSFLSLFLSVSPFAYIGIYL